MRRRSQADANRVVVSVVSKSAAISPGQGKVPLLALFMAGQVSHMQMREQVRTGEQAVFLRQNNGRLRIASKLVSASFFPFTSLSPLKF